VSIIYKKTYIYVKFLCCVEEYDENALLIITVLFEYCFLWRQTGILICLYMF